MQLQVAEISLWIAVNRIGPFEMPSRVKRQD